MEQETFHSQMIQEEYDAADRLMREKYTPVMT